METYFDIILAELKKVSAKNAVGFELDPQINAVRNKENKIQRYIINRYFTGVLLRSKVITNVKITKVVHYLNNSIDDKLWLNSILETIIPFVCKNNLLVLDVVNNKLTPEVAKGLVKWKSIKTTSIITEYYT